MGVYEPEVPLAALSPGSTSTPVDGDLAVLGGATSERTLTQHDVADEHRLLELPVVPGKRLLGETGRLAGFTLTDGAVTPRGVVISTYARDDVQPMRSVSDTMIPSGPRT